MAEYILIFAWIGIMFLAAKKEKYNRIEKVDGEIVTRCKPWFAVVAFVPVIWMTATRDLKIGDTGMYHDAFNRMPKGLASIGEYIASVTKDRGFALLSLLIKNFISTEFLVYALVIALIQGCILVMVYRKYSTSYVFSVFLFIISTDYVAWMYNGVRQFLAVTLIFAATELMIKKRYGLLVLIILLASTVHQSALLMIPLVFIAQGEAWNKKTLMFIAMALLAILFVGEFTNILDALLEDTQYSNVISDYESFRDNGTNPLRVLVYSVPALIAFGGRRIIKRVDDPLVNFCTNMSIISAGLYLISMVTSGIYMGRLPIYASLYGYILLPWEIENIFNKKSRKFVYATLIVCYALFYLFQMHFAWGLI